MGSAKDCCKPLSPEEVKLLRQAKRAMEFALHVSGPESNPPKGWKILASSAPDEATTKGFFARVYERTGPVAPGETRYMVAIRGTDSFSDGHDLKADFKIFMRFLPHQHWQALNFVKDICKANGINPAELEMSGNSLGGYLAKTAGSSLGVKRIWAFNSPGPPRKIVDYVANFYPGISKPIGDRLVSVRSAYDVISRWGYNEGIIFNVKTSGSPHSLITLRQGIDAAIANQAPPKVEKGKFFSLSGIYNRVSTRISESHAINGLVRLAMGQKKGVAHFRCAG